MTSLLYEVVSAMTAILVFTAWICPGCFKFLIDRDTGFPSGARQGQYTALLVSTWVLVTLTLKEGGIPEWFGTMFMLSWCGSQFASIWLKLKGQQQETPGTVTNTQTQEKTVAPAEVKKGKR